MIMRNRSCWSQQARAIGRLACSSCCGTSSSLRGTPECGTSESSTAFAWRTSMAHDLEFSLYRLLRFQRTPFFRPRPGGTIRVLPLHTLVRMLNQAAPHRFGNLRHDELLL